MLFDGTPPHPGAKGHKGLHLYTLNQEKVTFGVMEALGIKK